jgi:glyoxylase-like metal-dependent hydrolase (beta-lactamase superfamily II)
MSLPQHLSTGKAEGFTPRELVSQYELGTGKNLVYLVLDPISKEAAIVDPQRDLRPVMDLEANGFTLSAIVLTHTHHDHIAGVPSLLLQKPTLPIFVHEADTHRLNAIPQENLKLVRDGEHFQIGDTRFEAMHSPGHSAGEVTYVVTSPHSEARYLLTGDTLFIRDCGRTDFADGSNEEMFKTLQRIKALPDSLVVLPGHHYAAETASLLGDEKRRSPPLLCKTVESLAELP